MKNCIVLNIGLARNTGGNNRIETVALALRAEGMILTACRIVDGVWEGKPEQTLALEAIPALPLCHAECKLAVTVSIGRLAKELAQDCIAVVWPDGTGELVPNVGKFDPLFFEPVFTTGKNEVTSGW